MHWTNYLCSAGKNQKCDALNAHPPFVKCALVMYKVCMSYALEVVRTRTKYALNLLERLSNPYLALIPCIWNEVMHIYLAPDQPTIRGRRSKYTQVILKTFEGHAWCLILQRCWVELPPTSSGLASNSLAPRSLATYLVQPSYHAARHGAAPGTTRAQTASSGATWTIAIAWSIRLAGWHNRSILLD
jgi:hypothetical protein